MIGDTLCTTRVVHHHSSMARRCTASRGDWGGPAVSTVPPPRCFLRPPRALRAERRPTVAYPLGAQYDAFLLSPLSNVLVLASAGCLSCGHRLLLVPESSACYTAEKAKRRFHGTVRNKTRPSPLASCSRCLGTMTLPPPRPVHRGAGAAHASPASPSARRGLAEQAARTAAGFVHFLLQHYPSCLVEGVLHSARQLGHVGRASTLSHPAGADLSLDPLCFRATYEK